MHEAQRDVPTLAQRPGRGRPGAPARGHAARAAQDLDRAARHSTQGLSTGTSGDFPIARAVEGEFLDPEGVMLGTVATPLQHVGTGAWIEVSASGAGPPGARQARMNLRAVLVELPSPTLHSTISRY